MASCLCVASTLGVGLGGEGIHTVGVSGEGGQGTVCSVESVSGCKQALIACTL